MTQEDEVDIWGDDLLNRKSDAEFLIKFLTNRIDERKAAGSLGSYVLNLDAEWGIGKTFFMTRLHKQLLKEGHPVVFIDAWKNDFSDDPYTNVIAEIEQYFQQFVDRDNAKQSTFVKAYDAVKKNAGKIFWLGLKGGLKRGSRWLIAEGADEIVEVVDKHVVETGEAGKSLGDEVEQQIVKVTDDIIDAYAQKRIKDFEEAKISLERFRESLGALLTAFERMGERKLPFYILIDELDRCRPTYAIAMLERIKHLFDVDDVVFVLSTDTTQLAHSIRGVYGQTFDSRRYIRRFFSRTFLLPTPSNRALIDSILNSSGADESKWQAPGVANDARGFLAEASLRYKVSTRDLKQLIDILLSLTTTWKYNFPIQLLFMFPLIQGYIAGEEIDSFEADGWLLKSREMLGNWALDDQGSFGHRQFRQKNSVQNYLISLHEAVVSRMRKTLDKRPDYDSEKMEFYRAWSYGVMEREYAVRFSNVVRDEAVSIIRSYPSMIKYAGRLEE